MENLRNLWQLANTASALAEIARKSQLYTFKVSAPITFYMQAEAAQVRIARWEQARLEISAQLRVPMGWRVVTDQDDAGVYCVARRRPVVGGLAGAKFTITVPRDTYLLLKLADCDLRLDGVNGTFEFAAPHEADVVLPPVGEKRLPKGS